MSKELNKLINLAHMLPLNKSAKLTEGSDTVVDPNRTCLALEVVLL